MSTGSFVLNVNGDLYSATSAIVNLFGKPYVGLRTITYKEDVPTTPQNGTGNVSLGRTRGVYAVSVSIEILKHHGDLLIVDLQTKAETVGLGGWGEVPFNVEAKLRERPPLGLSAIDILGAKVQSSEEGIQTGGDAVVLKLELSVLRPIRRTIKGKVCTMVRDPFDNTGVDTILVGGGSVGAILTS